MLHNMGKLGDYEDPEFVTLMANKMDAALNDLVDIIFDYELAGGKIDDS